MKALTLYGPGDLRFEEVDNSEPREGWVRVRVKRVSIYGTDKARVNIGHSNYPLLLGMRL
ncbi:MAG: hypothetical protein DRO15_06440 [Thermoprotei archaeon]|nr:MAG: hypothetical protein DRO15_06440 [Thermoprotei archaeon]